MTSTLDDARGDLLALADEYEAGLKKMEVSGYEEFDGPRRTHRIIIDALRARARAAPARCDAETSEVVALREWKSAILGKCKASDGFSTMQWAGDKDGWGFIHYFIGHLETRALHAETVLVSPPSGAGREMLEAFQRIQGYSDNPGLVYTICSKMIDRLSPDQGTVAVASADREAP